MFTTDNFLELAARVEDLLPELEAAKVENDYGMVFIKHPLVNELYTGHAAIANHALREKKRAIAEYEAAGRYGVIITLMYARPWRLEALLKYADKLSDEEYWSVVGDVWTDSENIHENYELWCEVLTADRPGRDHMIDETELAILNALEEPITVYRGTKDPDTDTGLSWTLSYETAVWFAERWSDSGAVLERTVTKDEVAAVFNGRGEDEVVLLPY